jgi:hypothetical protein
MNREFKLQSGRLVMLQELRQRVTYEGLLNGLPTAEKNKALVKRLLTDQSLQPYGTAPVLLPFVERLIELPPGEEYPFGTPSALPSVTVIARFTSISPTLSGKGDASGLVVLWFQEAFSFPPSAETLSQLGVVDWEQHAGNYEL